MKLEFRELHGTLPSGDEILKSFRPGKSTIVTLGGCEGAVSLRPTAELVVSGAPQTLQR